MPPAPQKNNNPDSFCDLGRLRAGWWLVVIFSGLVLWKLFSLQVVQSDRFRDRADSSQVKSYEIEASRGLIYAHNGDQLAPLVLNERHWLVFSDTDFIRSVDEIVRVLTTNGVDVSPGEYEQLNSDSKYVVLGRGLTDEQKEAIESSGTRGVFFQKQNVRSYTEGSLAAHVLGFLNRDSVGQYGVEQQYDQVLTGEPGFVKSLTDVRGIPLTLDEENNIRVPPTAGADLVLTIDIPLQREVEQTLAEGVESTDGLSGSVVIMEAETGAVRALANYPTFDPAAYASTPTSEFINDAISSILEPASTVKTLTMATALDRGAVEIGDHFSNLPYVAIDGHRIHNAVEPGIDDPSMTELLLYSLNVGSVHLLEQLGGGEFNLSGRQALYDYFTNRFKLGQLTGIDLPGEVVGQVHPPDQGFARNLRYANMTFGQGMTTTPIQLAAAYSAIFNGGAYYQPQVVERIGDGEVEPKLVADNIIKPSTHASLRVMFDQMGEVRYGNIQYDGLEISAKTGTGQIASPDGGYLEDEYNGLIAGYIKGPTKTLVIVVVVEQPQVLFGGSHAAGPILYDLIHYLVRTGKAIN